MKLFVTGKLGASGNLVRQTLEGICMAILCSENKPLKFQKGEAVYWQLMEAEDERSEGNRAIYILEANYDKLGVLLEGAKQLKDTIKTYHQASHAGRLAIAYRIDLGPNAGKAQGYIGGHFDEAKVEGYAKELEQRIRLCGTVIETLDVLKPVIEELRKQIPKS